MKITVSLSAAAIKLTKVELTKIKKDATAYARELPLSQLVSILKTASSDYYNSGTSQLTDSQFDKFLAVLKERKPNHSFLTQVGAMPTGRKKVKLPYVMPSLDKVKPTEPSFEKWRKAHKGPWVVSDKEDGLSLEVIYEHGIPRKAYTRGKHNIGQDVSHLIPFLGIPLSIKESNLFVVRLELAMTEATFNKHFSKETSVTSGKKYENARNLVAGVVNTLKKEHSALGHIHTIAYEIIEPRMKPSQALAKLKTQGFHVVPYKLFTDLDPEELTKYLTLRKKKSPVAIDGLVIEQDKKTTRPAAGNPDYAVAFKDNDLLEKVLARVVAVEWKPSRHGKLIPIVHIEPYEK
jgi:DNA ligase (NAD+)